MNESNSAIVDGQADGILTGTDLATKPDETKKTQLTVKQFKALFSQWKAMRKKGSGLIVTRYTRRGRKVY